MDYAIFDGLIEGVQIIDADFRYVYVNDTVAAQGKSTRESLLGARMAERYPGIEHTEVYRRIGECLADRAPRQWINEFRFPDGSLGYFELRLQPVPAGVLVMSFDVTAQRRAEQALRDLNAELERRVAERTAELQAKNAELEQVAYIASHDLQEPLRTIQSHVEVLREEAGDLLTGDARTALGYVVDAADRMQKLVQALLDYSRIGRREGPVPTDLDGVLAGVLADLSPAITAGQARVEAAPLPRLTVYRAEFAQLFQNLLSNALKFRRPDVPPHVRLWAEPGDGAWVFHVADNGIGLDVRYKHRIFQLFQRLHTRSTYEGTGIGLAHCKKIVALHGGTIDVQSTPGEGSTFTFTVPRRDAEECRP